MSVDNTQTCVGTKYFRIIAETENRDADLMTLSEHARMAL